MNDPKRLVAILVKTKRVHIRSLIFLSYEQDEFMAGENVIHLSNVFWVLREQMRKNMGAH
jgi:hypothetical protein